MRHQLGNDAGAEIAEAALVLPIAFMFLLGIVWFGRAFNIYSTITQAAQQGAIAAARASCATCGSGNVSLSNLQIDGIVAGVLQASNLDPNQIPVSTSLPTISSCPGPVPAGTCTSTAHNITVCRPVLLNASAAGTQPSVCGAMVSFQYPFQFYLPFTSLNNQLIVLNAQSQSRMEN